MCLLTTRTAEVKPGLAEVAMNLRGCIDQTLANILVKALLMAKLCSDGYGHKR